MKRNPTANTRKKSECLQTSLSNAKTVGKTESQMSCSYCSVSRPI